MGRRSDFGKKSKEACTKPSRKSAGTGKRGCTKLSRNSAKAGERRCTKSCRNSSKAGDAEMLRREQNRFAGARTYSAADMQAETEELLRES